MGGRPVTGDEVRALCLSLPEATEKETWGDADNPGHPTFRVKDKIFVIMAVDGSGGSVKTSTEEQTALLASFPDAAKYAAYTGRYGWVDLDFAGIPDEVLRETIEGAWARTAPKKLAADWRAAR
jgi:predicted DNA-binding protein (MmcQ/YjbR family)